MVARQCSETWVTSPDKRLENFRRMSGHDYKALIGEEDFAIETNWEHIATPFPPRKRPTGIDLRGNRSAEFRLACQKGRQSARELNE